MLTQEQNQRLTQVGPGTPMGELMRRYWHPIAAAVEMGKFPVRRRLLGEDLVVYRDKDGTYGALNPVCPHRGATLDLALVESGGVRCPYHGWKFNETGQCTEQANAGGQPVQGQRAHDRVPGAGDGRSGVGVPGPAAGSAAAPVRPVRVGQLPA